MCGWFKLSLVNDRMIPNNRKWIHPPFYTSKFNIFFNPRVKYGSTPNRPLNFICFHACLLHFFLVHSFQSNPLFGGLRFEKVRVWKSYQTPKIEKKKCKALWDFKITLCDSEILLAFWNRKVLFCMVLKTEPGIKPFLKKFPVQPRFFGFWSVVGGFNRTGLAPGSQLNRSVRSGF